MRRIIRHPNTRLAVGFSLHSLSFLAAIVIAASLFQISILFSALCLGGLMLAGVGLNVYLAFTNRPRLEPIAKEQSENFDATLVGQKITPILRLLCQRMGLFLPDRTNDDGDGSYYAASQGWPKLERIYISDYMFDGILQNKIKPEEIKSTLAHELSHIYFSHTFQNMITAVINSIQRSLFYISMGITGLLLLQLGLATVVSLPFILFSNPSMATLGFLGASNFGLWLTSGISILSGMMIVRAQETQADFKGCETTKDPLLDYKHFKFENYIKEQDDAQYQLENNPLPYINPIINYFKSFNDSHPSVEDSLEDIACQFPEVKNFEFENKTLKQIYKRRYGR